MREICPVLDAQLAASDFGGEIAGLLAESFRLAPPRAWAIPGSLWWRRRIYLGDYVREPASAAENGDVGAHRSAQADLISAAAREGAALVRASRAAGRNAQAWAKDAADGYGWERTVVRIWQAADWAALFGAAPTAATSAAGPVPPALTRAAEADTAHLPLGAQLLYLVVGLRRHVEDLARASRAGEDRLHWDHVRAADVALFARQGAQVRHAADAREAAAFVEACTRSLAHAPYSNGISASYLQRVRGTLFPSPEPDALGGPAPPLPQDKRLTTVWYHQLQTIPGVSATRARALVRRFNSLATMMKELSALDTHNQRIDAIATAMDQQRRQPAIARRILNALFSADADAALD